MESSALCRIVDVFAVWLKLSSFCSSRDAMCHRLNSKSDKTNASWCLLAISFHFSVCDCSSSAIVLKSSSAKKHCGMSFLSMTFLPRIPSNQLVLLEGKLNSTSFVAGAPNRMALRRRFDMSPPLTAFRDANLLKASRPVRNRRFALLPLDTRIDLEP